MKNNLLKVVVQKKVKKVHPKFSFQTELQNDSNGVLKSFSPDILNESKTFKKDKHHFVDVFAQGITNNSFINNNTHFGR